MYESIAVPNIPEMPLLHIVEDAVEELDVDTMTMVETVLAVSAIDKRIQNDLYFMANKEDLLKVYKHLNILWRLHDKLHFVIASMEAMTQMKVK